MCSYIHVCTYAISIYMCVLFRSVCTIQFTLLNTFSTFVFAITAPHQPRLDWQMWFAALGSYQYNPWLVHLVYRLLIGQKEGTYIHVKLSQIA